MGKKKAADPNKCENNSRTGLQIPANSNLSTLSHSRAPIIAKENCTIKLIRGNSAILSIGEKATIGKITRNQSPIEIGDNSVITSIKHNNSFIRLGSNCVVKKIVKCTGHIIAGPGSSLGIPAKAGNTGRIRVSDFAFPLVFPNIYPVEEP